MYWRPVRESDLEHCLGIQPACIGDSRTGRDAAVRLWRQLFASPSFHGCVIGSANTNAEHGIIGCGIGVFVDSRFVDTELESPQPGLNSRVIASLASERSVVLERNAIAAGNAGTGLDFINLYGNWRDDLTDPAELAEVQSLLGESFVENLAGFRFNRVLKEAVGASTIELARATGTYRLIAEFAEHESALFAVSPDSARDAPYSLAAKIYRYRPPVLQLRPAEQALLAAARNGKTDAELSTTLGISVEAVKKRWISIFARIEVHKPEILMPADSDDSRRGPQKRHHIVAYIREHPEELRPYAW